MANHSKLVVQERPFIIGKSSVYYHGVFFENESAAGDLVTIKKPLSSDKDHIDHMLHDIHMTRLLSGGCRNVLNWFDVPAPLLSHAMLVVEEVKFGDLHHCLRSKSLPTVSLSDHLRMSLDIARGLLYLNLRDIVHGRLTTRSCFVTREGTVKIGNFSNAFHSHNPVDPRRSSESPLGFVLAYTCYLLDFVSDSYVAHRDDWFLAWEAYEVIFHSQCRTVKSDVWSFGTVMWEIFTSGRTPFSGETVSRTKKKIHSGTTLDLPGNCPPYVHELMLECWSRNVSGRRSIDGIVHELSAMLTNPSFGKSTIQGALEDMNLTELRSNSSSNSPESSSSDIRQQPNDEGITWDSRISGGGLHPAESTAAVVRAPISHVGHVRTSPPAEPSPARRSPEASSGERSHSVSQMQFKQSESSFPSSAAGEASKAKQTSSKGDSGLSSGPEHLPSRQDKMPRLRQLSTAESSTDRRAKRSNAITHQELAQGDILRLPLPQPEPRKRVAKRKLPAFIMEKSLSDGSLPTASSSCSDAGVRRIQRSFSAHDIRLATSSPSSGARQPPSSGEQGARHAANASVGKSESSPMPASSSS